MRMYLLRMRREELGLTPIEVATTANCPVETVLHGEFGIQVPAGEGLRVRLAGAYRLSTEEYLQLAFDAAEGFANRETLAY